MQVSDEGIKLMAAKKVVAVLLPTTAYVLRIQPPPARKLIDSGIFNFLFLLRQNSSSCGTIGVPVALGSDFNPNAHCLSMPFVMNLACTNMKMTLSEALVAATINAAGIFFHLQ